MSSYEARVERFYESGISRYTEPHDISHNSLCFGLWYPGTETYYQAARNLVDSMGTLLRLDTTSRLLDAGSGLGFEVCRLAERFAPDLIQCVDVTQKHIELSRALVGREQKRGVVPRNTEVRFYYGSATHMPFRQEFFTHVLALESPPHMDTRRDFLDEAYRMLAPGGKIACADLIMLRAPKNMWEVAFVRFAAWAWCVPRENLYDHKVLGEHISRAGFIDCKMNFVGHSVIPGYFRWHRRPEHIAMMRQHRGLIKGVWGGHIIDKLLLEAYRRKLCEYVIYTARKPDESLH